jgi:chromosome partitioning protein
VRVLTILGSKGGIGKSTLASNLLVAARLDGVDAVGVDLDAGQRTLAKWAGKRAAAGLEPTARVISGQMVAWRDAIAAVGKPALAVIDTPPGMDDAERITAVHGLAMASALVIVPALPQEITLEGIGELAAVLHGDVRVPTLLALNQVELPRSDLEEARQYLRGLAELCSVEIPRRVDIQREAGAGSSVVEAGGTGGGEAMRALWRFVAGRLGISG